MPSAVTQACTSEKSHVAWKLNLSVDYCAEQTQIFCRVRDLKWKMWFVELGKPLFGNLLRFPSEKSITPSGTELLCQHERRIEFIYLFQEIKARAVGEPLSPIHMRRRMAKNKMRSSLTKRIDFEADNARLITLTGVYSFDNFFGTCLNDLYRVKLITGSARRFHFLDMVSILSFIIR